MLNELSKSCTMLIYNVHCNMYCPFENHIIENDINNNDDDDDVTSRYKYPLQLTMKIHCK